MPNYSRKVAGRHTAIAVAIAFLFTHGALYPVGAYAQTPSTPAPVPSPTDIAAANAPILNTQGIQSAVTEKMNIAAGYATNLRTTTIEGLHGPLVKTKLQDMTCLDKIMAIKFGGLSNIDLNAIINGILNAAIYALLRAACSLVDAAWNSAMGQLNTMTKMDLGAAGSVSLVNTSGNTTTVGPSYSAGSDKAAALGIGMLTTPGTPTNVYGGAAPGAGAPAPASSQFTAIGAWDRFKNLFK